MSFSIISALGKNGEIGFENRLLWHISADLKRFKQITSGHTVIMGRLTYNSIGNKPLPRRRNIIISRSVHENCPNAEFVGSVDAAIELTKNDGEVFILGGATIYEQFLPFADKMYLTIVAKNYPNADTFFPDYDPKDWKVTEQIDVDNDEQAGVEYSFVTLERII